MSKNIEKRADYINLISELTGLSKEVSIQVFNGLKEGIVQTLRTGKSVTIFDLGTLSVKARAERVGRNPKTGEPLKIAAANVPGFKAGKALKEAVNSGLVVQD